MQRKRKIIISLIVLFVGICIFASEYFNSKKIQVYDYMNELYYADSINNISIDEINDDESNHDEKTKENNEEIKADTGYSFSENTDNSIYIGYLIIPDINLKKGFTTIDSKYNTVSKNIEILKSSDYPDKENGNVIFAAHSGNSSVSYFNKLYLLENGSDVLIEYNNKTYTYKITNIYYVEKTGKIEVKRNKNKSSITLITCTKGNNTTQTVYIGELINVQ